MEPAAFTSERSNQTRVRAFRRIVPSRWPFFIRGFLPLLGLLALAAFGVSRFAHGTIEGSATEQVRRALDEAGYTWATLDVSGQIATLSGAAPMPELGEAAVEVAREARCPTWLGPKVCTIRVVSEFLDAPPEWPHVTATAADGALRLAGDVSDDEARSRMVALGATAVASGRFLEMRDELGVRSHGSGPGVRAMEVLVARAGALCEEGETAFREGVFSVRCRVARAKEAALRGLIEKPLPAGSLGEVAILVSEDVARCEAGLSFLLEKSRIEFATGSADIVPGAAPLLDRIAEVATTCPGRLLIEGHTDSTGTPDANLSLSAARAEAVRDALAARGLPTDRLVARGFGQARPIADNGTREGRARNRRIEFRVTLASDS